MIERKNTIQPLSPLAEEDPQRYLSRFPAEQHLPTALMPLIGREDEVITISNLLSQPDVRLLTLTGPGGVGKTRLALNILAEVHTFFTDGMCFVSFARIRSGNLLFSIIAQSLGLNEAQEESYALAQIQAVIQNKKFLLLLDNFEHIADFAAHLKDLLAACPQLKILVTSRTVLSLLEEQEFYVAPLALPDLNSLPCCEDLAQIPTISLFLQRVRTTCPEFELTDENARSVAQICIRLDGLPLALELAAARMKIFSPQDLLERLKHRFKLLTSGTRGAPERQQTLRKTMEWSYHLLTQEEQLLFRHLSVFVGSCSLPAIEAISSAMSQQDEPLFDVVTSLLNHNLLQRESQEGSEDQRFAMLETIREYALECLQKSDEEQIIRQKYAEYYLALAKTTEQKIVSGESSRWIVWIESEFENLRAAFYWFLSSHDAERALDMSGALCEFWAQNRSEEGQRWVRMALDCCQDNKINVLDETKAQAMYTAAMLEYYKNNWVRADTYANEALQLFRSSNNILGVARVLTIQGMGALLKGHYKAAYAMADESIQVFQGTEYTWLLIEALLVQAYSIYFQGDHQQAYMIGKQGLNLSQSLDKSYVMLRLVYAQTLFAETQGNHAEIQKMFEEGMAITKATVKTHTHLPIAMSLVGIGAIVALQKQYTWAVCLWGKAKAIYNTHDELSELEPYAWLDTVLGTNLLCSQVLETVHKELGKHSFDTIWSEGQAMNLEQLLSGPDLFAHNAFPSKTPETYSHGLTPREREVLSLLAQGLSSASIAEQLVISLVTVNSHVRTIYSKLGISSRSAATRYALEHDMV